jgi:hypothetical protein
VAPHSVERQRPYHRHHARLGPDGVGSR